MFKKICKYSVAITLFFIMSACNVSRDGGHSGAINIILDTDMESDVDDVGALAMLHALADFGIYEILKAQLLSYSRISG
jgi:hypothetical protein